MEFYELEAFKKLVAALDEARRLKSNLLIVSLPGMGASYYLKKYLEKGKPGKYISEAEQDLEESNILDLDFDTNGKALVQVDEYLKRAGAEQKFAVVINMPQILEASRFLESYLGRHAYKTYYFGLPGEEVVLQMAKYMNVGLSKVQKEKILSLTGGVGRWVKFLLGHLDLLDKPDEMMMSDELWRVVEPTVKVVSRCSHEVLEKLGLGSDMPELVKMFANKSEGSGEVDVVVGRDLVLSESGEPGVRALKIEADILNLMLGNNGVVEKEKVADLKWGEGTYDKFSDQAINKTMRRLDKKLKAHRIETISGYGFKLVRR
ncbi:MAG: hypothetical protein G01um101416_958 [Microgenomates group bacterium Gr01-1014_16]|nr:MAG: hypothetical protein G01um101416_958 [Microgenomates group bacterium Gr01-1014_16]